jgi:hypothetical protein
MATALYLDATGVLAKFRPMLEPSQRELRMVFASIRLAKWIKEELPKLESTWKVEVTPQEQLLTFLELEFCPGETLTYQWQFKPLTHIRDGIWELKTPDLRIFGWFWRKDVFIGSAGDLKDRIKEHHLYRGYATEAAMFRNELGLDEPKFIPGDDPHAVVSNYGYPQPASRRTVYH